jgi:hypothetical protein
MKKLISSLFFILSCNFLSAQQESHRVAHEFCQNQYGKTMLDYVILTVNDKKGYRDGLYKKKRTIRKIKRIVKKCPTCFNCISYNETEMTAEILWNNGNKKYEIKLWLDYSTHLIKEIDFIEKWEKNTK